MASSRTDVVVLGAGIVGVAAALHLQAKGRAVTLVDRVASRRDRDQLRQFRHRPERGGLSLYVSARGRRDRPRRARPRSARAYPLRFAARDRAVAVALFPRLWRPAGASPARWRCAAWWRAALPEHQAFAEAARSAGAAARAAAGSRPIAPPRGQDIALRDMEETKPYGMPSAALNRAQLLALEPHLGEVVSGGVHFTEPMSTPDPQALSRPMRRCLSRAAAASSPATR